MKYREIIADNLSKVG